MKRTHSIITFAALLLVAFALVSCDTTTTKHATNTGSAPAGVNPADVNKLPTDIQQLNIKIDNGHFDADLYEMQIGTAQLVVTTVGGPYKLTVAKIFATEDLPANGQKTIGVNVPTSGIYTMTVTGAAEGSATLDVRPVGGK